MNTSDLTITNIDKAEVRRQAGYFNIAEAIRMVGADEWAFRYQLLLRTVPRPSIRIGGTPRLYYSAAEVEQIRQLVQQTRE